MFQLQDELRSRGQQEQQKRHLTKNHVIAVSIAAAEISNNFSAFILTIRKKRSIAH